MRLVDDAFRIAGGTLGLGFAVARRVVGTALSVAEAGRSILEGERPARDERPARPPADEPPVRRAKRERAQGPPPAAPPAARSAVVDPQPPPPAPPPEAPVDAGATLAAEFAEPGAEDGAGAQVSVSEPWEGYKRMTAAEIRRRLATAAPEEAAAVVLYEGANRARRSVLQAAERRTAGRPAGG